MGQNNVKIAFSGDHSSGRGRNSGSERRTGGGGNSAHGSPRPGDSSSGNRGGSEPHYSGEALSSFILAATSFVHAVQAERGGSSIYSASKGTQFQESLQLLRAVTDEMKERLAQTALFSKVQFLFTWDELDILRVRVNTLISFTECFRMYTLIVQRLLDMISKGLESLRHTHVGSTIASYLIFLNYKEYVGRERAFGGSLISVGGKFENNRLYTTFVGIKAAQTALSRAFLLTASIKAREVYMREVSVLPQELAEFTDKLLPSQSAAEEVMCDKTPEWWFKLMTIRMDVMETVQKCIIEEAHEQMGVKHVDKGVLSAPLLPAWERTIAQESHTEVSDGRKADAEDADYGKTYVTITNSQDPTKCTRIDFERQIGTGMGGAIFLGTLPPGVKCAVKVCDVIGPEGEEVEDAAELLREFVREVSVVGVMRHPNIVKLFGSCLRPPRYAMVLEYMDGGTLWDKLRGAPESINFLDFAIQMTRGLQYIHDVAGLMHRDLKSTNLLLNTRNRLKIADFGLCCLGDDGQTNQVMEILLHESYGQAADMYSYAIILWELLTKQIPYADLQTAGRLRKSTMSRLARDFMRLKMPDGTPSVIRKLISACWHPVPSKRPGIGHCLAVLEKYASSAKESDKKFLSRVHSPPGVEPFYS